VHAGAPEEEYWPATQLVHNAAPEGEKRPATHVLHVVFPVEEVTYFPAAHALQAEMEVADAE